MPKKTLKQIRARIAMSNEHPEVYIQGIGYLPHDRRHITTLGIRRMANTMCFSVLAYFMLQKMCLFPLTLFAYALGAEIQINYFTGLIVTTAFSKAIIMMASNIAALLISSFIVVLFYHQSYKASGIFKKPLRSITSLAVPMVLAIFLFSLFIVYFEQFLGAKAGIVFPFPFKTPRELSSSVIFDLSAGVLFVVLQEIFFRGLVLTPLRRFGDGFAVVVSSLLFAMWAGGAMEFIPCFLISLPLGYFVLRAGSVWTAVAARLTCQITLVLLLLCHGRLDPSLANVITLLLMILSGLFAAFAFITFIRADSRAFFLKRAEDGIKTTYKLSIFIGSLAFIALIVFLLMQAIGVMQIIG